ncbi:hypothetical protein [Luteolibacter sp. LG18]|uniref:hypothetical protein n=1 Tax=Luteolibacter sp. LG18 TaxID=2819286 RepID=UPI002B3052F3|nr:hypothetical protein llg_04300 [Luteolibacter sp. LG18]
MDERGFSLVITLLMMILLSILALGLLSLSSISLRTSTKGAAQATARANARMALALAIGQLQTLAGQDTRATASAAQLELDAKAGSAAKSQDVVQPHWVGVWPTTVSAGTNTGFLVGRFGSGADKENYLMDVRNASTPASGDGTFDATRNDFSGKGQLGWLVSSPAGTTPDPRTFSASEETSKVLFGAEWARSSDPVLKKKAVSAPLVRVKDALNQDGAYAYWVSDESEKANIAVDGTQIEGSQNSLAVAQTSQADLVDAAFQGHGALARKQGSPVSKVGTLNTSALLPLSGGSGNLPEMVKQHAHDLTATSVGLLTNPQTGGYQQDLSAFLARSETITDSTSLSASSSGFNADGSIGTPGLSIGTPLVYGERHTETAPRFGALKAWADLAKTVNGSGANAQIAATLPPFTTTHPYKGPDITRIAAQAIHPVMTEFTVGFDFSPFSTPQTGRAADKDGLRLHLYPRVVLWNPYNVAINAPAYLAVMRYDPRVSFTMRGTSLTSSYYATNSSSHYAYPYLLSMLEQDENYTNNCLVFSTEPAVIPPGQALVFTPDSSKGAGGLLNGTAAKYDPRNLEMNVLTCRQPVGQENFYADAPITSRFAGVPKTGDNTVYRWSYTNDVGMFYQFKPLPRGAKAVTIKDVVNYQSLQYVVPNAQGTSYLTYEGLKDGTNSEGQIFEEYGLRTKRHQQSTWRVGVRVRYFDESNEWSVRTNDGALVMGATPFVSAWAQYNLRGGHVHTAWLGPNVNYNSDVGKAWEWNPGGNYINVRNHISNDDPRVQAVPNDNGQFTMPPFGTAQDLGGVQSFVFYEIPRQDTPVASLAQFQNAELSYQNYQPGNVVGWSFQSTLSERGATVVRPGRAGSATVSTQDDISQAGRWTTGHAGLIQRDKTQKDGILLYDMPFEVNQRLFDNYYLSTIPYGSSGSTWNLQTALPNGRLRPVFSNSVSESRAQLGNLETAFNKSAALLGNYGAFNVNSTSEDAWVAHLSALRGLKRNTLQGSGGTDSPYSRFQTAPAFSGAPSSWIDPAAWSSSRGLSDDEIRKLAAAIVTEVKLRGPFVSLSDFVNRRLVDAPSSASSSLTEDPERATLEATGRYGALDAAIRRAGLNKSLETPGSGGTLKGRLAGCEQVVTSDDLAKGYVPYGSQPDYKTIGLPGYLTQGDLLSSLAPTLTARGDTFLVRAYGDARDGEGKVVASTWCEAVVQRTPDYVDPANESATRALIPASSTVNSPFLSENGKLSALNKQFGRRYQIVSFRWLKASEV